MGERLFTRVYLSRKEKMPILGIYQHWSGYSDTTLDTVKTLLTSYKQNYKPGFSLKQIFDITEKALTTTYGNEVATAGIGSRTHLSEEQKQDGYVLATDRNVGIIDITAVDMAESLRWSEHTVSIYLNSLTADIRGAFIVAGSPSRLDKINENWELTEGDEEYLHSAETLPRNDKKLSKVSIEDLKELELFLFGDKEKSISGIKKSFFINGNNVLLIIQ